MDFINALMPNFERLSGELLECIGQTFTMLAVSGSIAWVLGVAVGVLLTVCRPGGILENRWLFTIFDRGIDIIRSIPFIILIVLLIPVSRFLVGTGSGVTGSFVALVAGTVPFFARQIESVLADIDHGLIEASQAMGFSPREIIFSVYLRESIPGITRVTMITFVSLVGITAIAGAIGAGGLGDFAIRYGYQMGYRDMIWLTVIIILAIISVFQFFGFVDDLIFCLFEFMAGTPEGTGDFRNPLCPEQKKDGDKNNKNFSETKRHKDTPFLSALSCGRRKNLHA